MEKKTLWDRIFETAMKYKTARMSLWMLLKLLLHGIIDVLTGVWMCVRAIITMIVGFVLVAYLFICCTFNFPLPEWVGSLDEPTAHDDSGTSNEQITFDVEPNANSDNCSKSDESKNR